MYIDALEDKADFLPEKQLGKLDLFLFPSNSCSTASVGITFSTTFQARSPGM
jgi:hypothetical protein